MMGTFALDISRFVAKANGNVDLVIKKITFDIFHRVIMKTPVLSGRARGNWAPSIGEPAAASNRPVDPSGSATIAEMSSVVNGQMTAGKIIFLTNTLPYILRLEDGYSQQAPVGMVYTTLREFPGVVESAAGSVR
jgi:hypothetical protein